jgi:hypothetical protein
MALGAPVRRERARPTCCHHGWMANQVDPPICRRCGRSVDLNRSRLDLFEQTHQVCFHYEFEHDPFDPDEECEAGDCPSAAINPRPERRPKGRTTPPS